MADAVRDYPSCVVLGEALVSAGRGDEMAAAGAGHGHLRASQGALLSAWQGMGVFCG